MTLASAETLGRHLRPLCSRDNHAMKYESSGSSSNNGDNEASYHCRYMSCGVRYNLTLAFFGIVASKAATTVVRLIQKAIGSEPEMDKSGHDRAAVGRQK